MKEYPKFQSLLVTGILVLTTLVGISGCGGQKVPVEIKVGVIAPLTGDKAAIGEATVNAAELAVNDLGQSVRDRSSRQDTAVVIGQSLQFPAVRLTSRDGNLSVLVHAGVHGPGVPIVEVALLLDDHGVAVALLVFQRPDQLFRLGEHLGQGGFQRHQPGPGLGCAVRQTQLAQAVLQNVRVGLLAE